MISQQFKSDSKSSGELFEQQNPSALKKQEHI